VNEYGVFRGEERLAGVSEEEVYAALGLAWIPPELREDRGEVEAAAHGKVPTLVAEGDLVGDLHLHLASDARPEAVDRLVAEGRSRGYAYLGFVVGGLRADGTAWAVPEATRSHLSALSSSTLRVLRAVEVGRGPVPNDLATVGHDYLIVRPLAAASGEPGADTAAAPPRLVAHVGSGTVSDAAPLATWIEFARRTGAAVEVGPGPERLDSTAGRPAREAGVALHLPTGLGAPSDDPTRPVALGFARRAGLAAGEVVNARPLAELRIAGSEGSRGSTGRSSDPRRARSGKRGAA
jgi:DNA polymerase (family 10)